MKKLSAIFCTFLIALLATFCLVACVGGNSGSASSGEETDENYVDVFMFMGQSNMGGRGTASESIVCGAGHGFEFKAVTDPTALYPLEEPFGALENNEGISDMSGRDPKKTGGLVSAFCEAYYQETGIPVVGVSASQGGTNSTEWQPGNGLLEEAQRRLQLCLDYMCSQDEYVVRHIEMVWLQGESDAGAQVPYETYSANMQNVVNGMKAIGVEHCFLIQIGDYMESVREDYFERYRVFQTLQAEMCENLEDFTLVSIKLSGMPESMMHLNNHFRQPAYNIVGNDAGKNTAYYMQTGNAPVCAPYVNGETPSV